jgi:hypothetical protein
MYRAMKAYGCHYRVLEDWDTKGYATYNSGLISVAQQMAEGKSDTLIEMGYVGELVAIYELNYDGADEPVILMKGQWVAPKWSCSRHTMIRDLDGLLLANFYTAAATLIDPFIFPSQVEQAFFLGC